MNIKICCIKLSLAARVIGMVGLITSVLVFTQLSTELAEQEGNRGTASILLGLDIDEFMSKDGKNYQINYGREIMIAFLVFAFFYAVSCAILIWGTIVEKSCFAIPWLVCELVSFLTQIATLSIHGMTWTTRDDKWIILLSIVNILLTMYFWIVVFDAQRLWSKQRRESKENETTSTSSGNDTLQDEVFDSTVPTSNQKYIQV